MHINLRQLSGGPLPAFDCGVLEQNEFLANFARASQQAGLSATYIALRDTQMLGFATLAMSTVQFERHERPPEAPVNVMPAVLVAHLAVDKSSAKRGVGAWLLRIARGVAQSLRYQIGCRFLAVDCAPELVQYYRQRGFKESKGEQRRRKKALELAPDRTPTYRLFQDLHSADYTESENAPPHHQSSELHLAAGENDIEMLAALLYAGVLPNLRIRRGDDGLGWGATPLHVAAAAGALEAIETLAGAGAEIDARDADNETPLHWAVRHDQLLSVELLLRHRASSAIAGGEGVLTPLDYAVHGGHVAIAKALRDAGAGHSSNWTLDAFE